MALSKQDIENIAAALQSRGGNGAKSGGVRDAFFISVESTIAPGASDTQRVTLDVDADFLIVTAVGVIAGTMLAPEEQPRRAEPGWR